MRDNMPETRMVFNAREGTATFEAYEGTGFETWYSFSENVITILETGKFDGTKEEFYDVVRRIQFFANGIATQLAPASGARGEFKDEISKKDGKLSATIWQEGTEMTNLEYENGILELDAKEEVMMNFHEFLKFVVFLTRFEAHLMAFE